MTAAIDPEKILRDLRDLWAKLGNEQKESSGVLRACAMTLIAIVEDQPTADKVRKTLGAVMHHHPSRAIVLRMTPGAEPDARVFSECWTPQGGQSQICAEGIEITTDAAMRSSATQLILPLLAPDLPVVLWYCGDFRNRQGNEADLLRLVQKVIVDSGVIDDALAGIEAVRDLRALSSSTWLRVADLAWTRLTGWREGVANAFACKKWQPAGVTNVRIEFGGEPSSGVIYLKRWIERALPSARVTIENEPGERGLQAVSLSGGSSDDEVLLKLTGPGTFEVRAGDCSARSSLPSAGDEALLREELSILGADTVFEAMLESSPK